MTTPHQLTQHPKEMAETKPPESEAKPVTTAGKKNTTPEDEILEYVDVVRSVTYQKGDTVYIESQRSDMPYFICTIRNFTRNKKDNVNVDVCWLYRPCEIPTSVYELLSQVSCLYIAYYIHYNL